MDGDYIRSDDNGYSVLGSYRSPVRPTYLPGRCDQYLVLAWVRKVLCGTIPCSVDSAEFPYTVLKIH